MTYRITLTSILTILFIISLLFIGCEKETKKIRFAVIKYQQETCTFCPGGDAGIKDWTTNGPYLKGEKLINYNNGEPNSNYISGFVLCQGVWEVVFSVVASQYVGVVEMGSSIGSGFCKDSINE